MGTGTGAGTGTTRFSAVLTFGSLFAGIGGFDLGLERAGLECRWQVEIDAYASRVLERHWPGVSRHHDILDYPTSATEYVDVICGGFPCQDISRAGNRGGLAGERSGLFYELMRVVRILRPRVVLLENVSAILNCGFGEVLRELATSGFDAEWSCIPAAGIGAPHVRDRMFLAAYAHGQLGRTRLRIFDEDNWQVPLSKDQYRERAAALGWAVEAAPQPGRMDDELSARVDRRKCLGNAVVPQLAEFIGRGLIRVLDSISAEAEA